MKKKNISQGEQNQLPDCLYIKKAACLSGCRIVQFYKFEFVMPFSVLLKPLTDGCFKGFPDIFPGSVRMLLFADILFPAFQLLFIEQRFNAFFNRFGEKVVLVDFQGFNTVVEDFGIRKLKDDPVAVRSHDYFTQVNADAGGIAVTDGGCADGSQDNNVGLGFKNALFINGGYFQPFAGLQLLDRKSVV